MDQTTIQCVPFLIAASDGLLHSRLQWCNATFLQLTLLYAKSRIIFYSVRFHVAASADRDSDTEK